MRHKHIPTTIIKPDFRSMIFATSSITAGFLLRFADQHYSTMLVKFRQMSSRCFVLFFSRRKTDDCQTSFLCELLHSCPKCFTHRRQQHGRWDWKSHLLPNKVNQPACHLQVFDASVQIPPVGTFYVGVSLIGRS